MMSLRRCRQGKGKRRTKGRLMLSKESYSLSSHKEKKRRRKRKKNTKQTEREEKGKQRKESKQHQENFKWRWLACFHPTKNLLLRKVGYIYLFMNIYVALCRTPGALGVPLLQCSCLSVAILGNFGVGLLWMQHV